MTRDPGISRRDLFRMRFGLAKQPDDAQRQAPPSTSQQTMRVARRDATPAAPRSRHASFPVLRPPGAVAEPDFLEKCTKCGDCLTACPHDAIINAPARFRAAAGTPMIDPASSPCRMCDDTPCIAACETGALLPTDRIRMGTARISNFDCIAHQGSFCSVCFEQCPVEGAIEIHSGRPTVVESRCTGCGVCHYACPAPTNAILIMPLAERGSP